MPPDASYSEQARRPSNWSTGRPSQKTVTFALGIGSWVSQLEVSELEVSELRIQGLERMLSDHN